MAWALYLLVALLASGALAAAQGTSEFTLSPASLDPQAVVPGGTSSSSITIGSVNGFNGNVSLSCQVTSTQITTSTPVCTVSPQSVAPPATATATITTTAQTTTVGYSVTITGTGPTTTYTTGPLLLTVLAVTPQFTITVSSAVAPNSVTAGSGAEGIVSVNSINGYLSPSGGVTLYCSSITPLVTTPPVCSFSYPNGQKSLTINSSQVSSTLTINTFGPVTKSSALRTPPFSPLWLPVPLLGLAGLGVAASGKRSCKAWALLSLFVLSGCLLLLPSCSSSTTATTTTPNGVTPANTYTFTIVGVDSDGVVSSNAGTTTSGPTVTLSVTAPK